ncbi:uncharacterized protein NECHADRAFT_83762 [Fusarium vanettenii 77-13-4]|uniref:Uncharacterized protein n=1 Tax=Fusarium vanettenii (strain ATCC MYA-4622 / CBS 123669 / FGSC 9596 / NRRL 45880 / 77-13-4) TaxID=660122 RepID=C7YYP8_FUSV7|nr:uncharacterized protein NECHADRAFT_83762 [Fusarium vanettenii 77-13-4]EEU43229.1 hypothetical protein NECHADRAFT_83762 [Fusarium vanettenii 77-13-4]
MPNNKNTADPQEPPPPPPPRAPPDLLTMVKLVFYIRVNAVLHQRQEAADREVDEYWRMRDEKDAKKAVKPVRQRAREIQEKREAMRRPAPYIYRRPEVDPREKLTWREIDRLMDEEVEKEVNVGLGLKRAEGETLKAYYQRMDDLEHRLDRWISIEYYRQQNGPLRYMDGMPIRARSGPESEKGGLFEIEDQAECVRKWMDKIKESQRIKPLPAWHENDHSENKRDDEYQPKGWWHVLKDGLTEW